uniref:Uncharacterized protein n=1 Tax=Kalanchoe fedtschenkoi TaxID=63787 RepID=A0A7N0RH22_KALFE
MEEILNGSLTEDTSQKSEVVVVQEVDVVMPDDDSLGMRSVVDEERFEVAAGENGVENGKDGVGSSSSSSSSDEETEVAAEKIDEIIASMVECGSEENGVVSGLVAEEEAAVEITEGLEVAMVVEEEEEKITVEAVEEEREVTVAEDSEAVEVAAVELTDAVEEKAVAAAEEEPDQVEAVDEVLAAVAKAREVEVAGQEATDGLLKHEEESSPAVAKSVNDAEIPESNGNPHIISISTRTVQRTSWSGCCGLLQVFRRGDRG